LKYIYVGYTSYLCVCLSVCVWAMQVGVMYVCVSFDVPSAARSLLFLIWLKMLRQTVHLRAPLPDQIPWKHREHAYTALGPRNQSL